METFISLNKRITEACSISGFKEPRFFFIQKLHKSKLREQNLISSANKRNNKIRKQILTVRPVSEPARSVCFHTS